MEGKKGWASKRGRNEQKGFLTEKTWGKGWCTKEENNIVFIEEKGIKESN